MEPDGSEMNSSPERSDPICYCDCCHVNFVVRHGSAVLLLNFMWNNSSIIYIHLPYIEKHHCCFNYSNTICLLFLSICGWELDVTTWCFRECIFKRSQCFIFLSCLCLCRYWFFKFAALVALNVAAFYIPDQPFTYCKARTSVDWSCFWRWHHRYKFCVYSCVTVWFIVGSAGAFFFVLIQLVLLVDFAHSWNESWVEKMETENAQFWYIGERLNLGKCFCDSADTDNVAFSSNLCW